ncbi:Molybdopterin-guanine dinucleotide biosynthesis protein MobB [Caenispirillum salinarum AK4]|uniref:Molybdopterin-guanine dinucleotide biosynthesis protein MobB n=1 Tax=Caenispirillum salinarum AK4 TaxID=1238182 RepID=K9GW87_9PROT|nr:molybdopterin-guanine dinucleotide biosynthesis protein B [Caenispirillum salinarum]EKV29512.1 Molybdopterin-guanine dinucleotide biosynthesis protein MobB [Caenispirillum salinarum AK4]
MKVFGLAGWSNSGKTTLMTAAVTILTRRGFRISTIKHAHHAFDIDRPGKDSFRHREAGASEVLITSGRRWALMHELRDEDEPSLEDLVARMTPVDLLLVEGFKRHPHPKIEVHRPSVGKDPLWPQDDSVVAVASDEGLPDLTDRPRLDLNDPEAVVDFVLDHVGLPRTMGMETAQ